MTRRQRPSAGPLGLACVALALAVAPVDAGAQIADTTKPAIDSVLVTPEADARLIPAIDTVAEPMTPRGAFIRSMVIPGWGQSAFDSYTRGGVYFAGWAANWFMLFRNQVRLNDARDRYDLRAAQIRYELIAAASKEGDRANRWWQPADSMTRALDEDPTILEQAIRDDEGEGGHGNNLRKLVRAREQQREDWIAWSIFWVLASGIDAYVTAHLHDMPTGIELRTNPDRSLSVQLSVPVGGGR